MSVFLERQSVRKRRHWMRKLVQLERLLLSAAIVLAGLACLYGLYRVVFLGPTFSVRRIVVEGNLKYSTPDGLAELSGVKEGDNLFWVSMANVHERLGLNPWVATTAVARRLPDALWIYVEEHNPTALVLAEDGLFYVDEEGHPFKRVEAADDKDFPILTGLRVGEGGKIDDENGSRMREMLLLIDSFRASGFGRGRDIAEVHYDRVGGYSAVVEDEQGGDAGKALGLPVQIFFGHAALGERMGQLDRMFDAISKRPGRIQYMLANEPKRIVVKYRTS